MRYSDVFGSCHPAVNFLYFVLVIAFSMCLTHPVCLLLSVCGAVIYHAVLLGSRSLRKSAVWMVPMAVLAAVINPAFTHQGVTILAYLPSGNPLTLESMLYGLASAALLSATLLWFTCYNAVMTSDKFMSLFGNLIPSLSLLLVMVFRLVPRFFRQTRQLLGTRRSVGKGAGSGYREKVAAGMTVLSSMTSWALEGSVITAASMRSRGYGTARRSCFRIFHVAVRDWALLVTMLLLAAAVLGVAALGGVAADFIPRLSFAPISGWYALGFVAYCGYLLIPTVLHLREALQWHILRSRI